MPRACHQRIEGPSHTTPKGAADQLTPLVSLSVFCPSPTLSPTDPVPRGLLTLCPWASHCASSLTYTPARAYTHTHTHTHTRARAHTHTHTQLSLPPLPRAGVSGSRAGAHKAQQESETRDALLVFDRMPAKAQPLLARRTVSETPARTLTCQKAMPNRGHRRTQTDTDGHRRTQTDTDGPDELLDAGKGGGIFGERACVFRLLTHTVSHTRAFADTHSVTHTCFC